ncbi:MAG TPA: hypothetical protein VEU33_28110 [Archangium sp.]|nr:hypothetical protein [Archangium sp.]
MLALSKEPIAKCPLNWIDLEYLYNDNEPVAGAKYTVKDADSGFCVSGSLDQSGRAHVELPSGLSQVSFSFHDDPDDLQIKIQPKPHGQKAEPGWLERIGDSLADVGMWIWGVVPGLIQSP